MYWSNYFLDCTSGSNTTIQMSIEAIDTAIESDTTWKRVWTNVANWTTPPIARGKFKVKLNSRFV